MVFRGPTLTVLSNCPTLHCVENSIGYSDTNSDTYYFYIVAIFSSILLHMPEHCTHTIIHLKYIKLKDLLLRIVMYCKYLIPGSPRSQRVNMLMLTIRECSDGFCIWIENNPPYETITWLSTSLIFQEIVCSSTLYFLIFRKCYIIAARSRVETGLAGLGAFLALCDLSSLLGRTVIVASLF